MGDRRIKIAKDKAALVQALLASDDTTGPFQTYADIVAFAAAMGFKHGKRLPLTGEISKRDPAPVNRETFASKGYEMILNLIAIAETDRPNILAPDTESSVERLSIFEEYVNGGLEALDNIFQGSIDYSDQLLLALGQARTANDPIEQEFDLENFL